MFYWKPFQSYFKVAKCLKPYVKPASLFCLDISRSGQVYQTWS